MIGYTLPGATDFYFLLSLLKINNMTTAWGIVRGGCLIT